MTDNTKNFTYDGNNALRDMVLETFGGTVRKRAPKPEDSDGTGVEEQGVIPVGAETGDVIALSNGVADADSEGDFLWRTGDLVDSPELSGEVPVESRTGAEEPRVEEEAAFLGAGDDATGTEEAEDVAILESVPAEASHADEEETAEPRTRFPSVAEIAKIIPDCVSLDSLRQVGMVPLRSEEDILIVAVSSLAAYPRAQLLGTVIGKPVDVEVCEEKTIDDAIHALYDYRSGVTDKAAEAMEGIDDIDDLAREDVMSDSVDVPVIRLVNGLILDAIKQRATDIHVEPYEDSVLIRFRVDGVLQDRLRLPRGHQAPLTSRIKVMAKMDIAEHMAPQDGRIGITVGNKAVDIRVGSVPVQFGERIAMRLLDKGHGLLTLEDLGMEKRERSIMDEMILRPNGMILFTGPTGSGKTTTMYAILQALAQPAVNIITVEDPIEYDLPGVAQIQVNEKAGVTFAAALRSILRQDPDIIMIGEMRDFETAHIGVQSSLTGHLVLSTLHTNDSVGAIVRLIDMGIEPFLAASSMIGTVAQRLVRRVCPQCREKSADVPAMLAKQGVRAVYRGRGCDYCMNTGYRGRVGLYEQFLVTEEIREAIAESKASSVLRDMARKSGFRTIWEIGLDAVARGLTTPEELARVAGDE